MRPVLLARCLPDFRRLTSWFLASFLLLSAVSCKAKPQSEGQKKFGDDADYFIGLRFLEDGNEVRIKAEDDLARVLLHEIDHLEGILFIDHIKDVKDAFYEMDDKGDLKPLDYDSQIAHNKDLFPDED